MMARPTRQFSFNPHNSDSRPAPARRCRNIEEIAHADQLLGLRRRCMEQDPGEL